jgi:hypothetical protein
MSFRLACPLLLVGLCMVGTARAEVESDLQRARAQFDQALSLEVAGDWGGALGKLSEVARVRLTPQVRFHIGRCKEHLGRLTEALGDYRLAQHDDSEISPEDREEILRAHGGLEPRIPKVVVVMPGNTSSLHVELDGVEIGAARLGQPISVDPGPRKIVVRRSDGRRFEQDVMAVERETTRVDVVLPAGFLPARGLLRTEGAAAPTAPGSATPSAEPRRPLWPYVVGGVGVAGMVGAGVLYYVRQSARQTLDSECVDGVCPERLRSVQTRGERASVGIPIALAVGVLGLGIGGYGWLSEERTTEKTAQLSSPNWSVQVGERFVGVDVAQPF